jgi:zinc protease
MLYPTVEQFSEDSYALDVLADLIGRGKKSPLYKVIVEEKKLAPAVSTFQNSSDIAGDFRIRIRTFPNKNLTDVEKAIKEAFTKFEKEGFTEKDLARTKAGIETAFYNGISSVMGKAQQLGIYNTFASSPDFLTQDLNNSLKVTSEDVWRVYNKYVKGQKYVLISFVPKGKLDLAAENSPLFDVPGDNLKTYSEEEKTVIKNKPENLIKVDKIQSSFDRSQQPQNGPDPLLKTQSIWDDKLSNGIKVLGIEHKELPLVDFQISVKGGLLLDDINKVGSANLVAKMLMQGTKNKTPLELEQAIEDLGSSISVAATDDAVVIRGNCLSSKFEETFKLVEEILFKPRWDVKEFDRLKNETIEVIKRIKTSANNTASLVYARLIYGDENILSKNIAGTEQSVAAIALDDLKNYYAKSFSPQLSNITISGDVSEKAAMNVFKRLENKWKTIDVNVPQPKVFKTFTSSSLYFVDFPGARQSEIRIGTSGLAYTHPDYFKTTVMNYALGGSFNGRVNMVLREEKGYTYGARTNFVGSEFPGYFVASAGVQSNATLESAEIFRDEMIKYRKGITPEDLQFTKNALLKSNALKFETINALRGMLSLIIKYDLPYDYMKDQEKQIMGMTLDEHKSLAEKYIQPDKMIYLIVGDAKTQLENVKKLGLGDPIMLDKDGNKIANE